MARTKKTVTDDGSFRTQGVKEGKIINEAKEELRGISFDAHFVTGKIVQYGKILTGIPLYRYQEAMAYRIIYAIVSLEGTTISMLLARQSGKSETLAFVVNALSTILPALAQVIPDLDQFKEGIKIGLFAPQSDQVYTTYNRALMRLTNENAEAVMGDPDLQVSLEKPSRYELSNGSFMLGQVASKQSKIESKTYDLVLIEEAQDMDSFIVQKSIEPMITATGGTIVKCGTTGVSKNDFWYDIQYNRNKSRSIKDERLHLHWEFNYKKIFLDKRYQYEKDNKLFHLNYEKDVTKKMDKWGRESQPFRLAYALEWDLESGMLMTDKEFEKCCNRKKGLGNFDDDDIMIAGLDLGKDIASTVLTIAKLVFDPNDTGEPPKKEIVSWLELSQVNYDDQHYIIVEALQLFNVVNLYVDYTGVGKPFVDRLAATVGDVVNITPYNFSKQSKSDMWFNLVDHVNSGRLIIPANKIAKSSPEWHHFQEQLLNCQKWFDGSYMCAEKSEGYNDDFCDSLGLMLLADNFVESYEVEVDEFNPFFDQTLSDRDFYKRLSY